ncbi:hypothetical protein BHM03_00024020 [Ensete ventricosum]|nr:hypothetical protein BHM03_00024020 [Ensete ventricosum]
MDGATSAEYARGVLIPRLAADLYSSQSEVLIKQALKTMVLSQHYYIALADHVHDAGQVIRVMDNKVEGLKEIKDLNVGSGPKAIIATETTSLRGASPHRSPQGRARGGDSTTGVSGIGAKRLPSPPR